MQEICKNLFIFIVITFYQPVILLSEPFKTKEVDERKHNKKQRSLNIGTNNIVHTPYRSEKYFIKNYDKEAEYLDYYAHYFRKDTPENWIEKTFNSYF